MSLTKATYSMIQGAVVNVLDYGADSTGTNDSTAAFQAAIDSLSVDLTTQNQSGGTVYIPKGNYEISEITLPSGVSLVGDGAKSSRLFSNTASTMISYADITNYELPRNLIEGILFDGGGSSTSGASRIALCGINSSGFYVATIRNCTFVRFATAAIYSENQTVDFVVERCLFYVNARAVWHIAASSTTIRYIHCYFSFSDGFGVVVNSEIEVYFDNCLFEKNGNSGAYIDGGTVSFRKCYFEQNGTGQVALNNMNVNNAISVVVDDCYFTIYSDAPIGSSSVFVGELVTSIDFNNNLFNGGASPGTGCANIAGAFTANRITERNSTNYGAWEMYSPNVNLRLGTFKNITSPTPTSLSYYEEGRFTPIIVGLSSTGTATYSSQFGTYTRIGRLVTVQISISWSGATGTGAMAIGSLPFVSALENTASSFTIGQASLPNTVVTQVSGTLAATDNRIVLTQYSSGNTINPSVSSSGSLVISGSYIV